MVCMCLTTECASVKMYATKLKSIKRHLYMECYVILCHLTKPIPTRCDIVLTIKFAAKPMSCDSPSLDLLQRVCNNMYNTSNYYSSQLTNQISNTYTDSPKIQTQLRIIILGLFLHVTRSNGIIRFQINSYICIVYMTRSLYYVM